MAGERRRQNVAIAAGAAAMQAEALAEIALAWFEDPEMARPFMESSQEYQDAAEEFAANAPEITAILIQQMLEEQQAAEQAKAEE